ncbi:hypothetical protein BST97_08620 [Nonlabens spongiae]|uniref:Secretion system C-terminal sorting domain-containing protein n=1 Tax=Nonlabens spongiae TaxID=331648 RepID=A0A1W6MKQ1_9FLAO|nr:T9SS type A sorting domain-containing protein [Nonlabens spongiae]ARN78059.1 hypothetical protein BST97_08620 [Nonlabens spongiae]
MEHIRQIAVDSQNNYYFLAVVSGGNTDLNGQPFTNYNRPSGSTDTFLFSTDCSGNFRWQKTIGSYGTDQPQHLSIDSNDNIYVSGRFLPRLNSSDGFTHFDNDVIINSPLTISTPGPHNKSIYLIKYDRGGNFQWLELPQKDQADISTIQNSYSFGHVTDSSGVTHWLMTMGPGTHLNGAYTTSTNEYGIFRFDDQGSYLGHTPVDMGFNGGRATYGTTLEYDELLDRYYISWYSDPRSADNFQFMGNMLNTSTMLAAIENGTGNLIWMKESTRTGNTQILSTKVDDQSNVYISGIGFTYTTGADGIAGYFFTNTRTNGNMSGGAPFLIKLDPQGNLLWGTNPDFNADRGAYDITINGNEVAIATGLLVSTNWGGAAYSDNGATDEQPVVARFDAATGATLGLHPIRGSGGSEDLATAIATDTFGNYAVGGYMFSSSLFQNSPGITPLQRNGSGRTDFWFARLATTDCAGVPLSTDQVVKEGFSLYPNPTNGLVSIRTSSQIDRLSIHDLSGRLVQQPELDGSNRMDVSSLPTGVYLVTLKSVHGESTLKLVRE